MKIHLRRAADGAYFPACCVSYLRPDPKKALLPTTEITELVTCKRCQQMIFSERHYAAIVKLRAKEEGASC